ncbi:uncharacterized protein PHALS_06418 [Plasmopara halstedii]|uniref:Uncharacterized protein n=1 Tax=Plasmopara halstedii TaxID=4781 RepID=A0A0P1B4R3_PLAHL|nr:uncharacterized protein PHALS_06418 [Plasmopara halstedii]CEG48605.1 hypothetical protein PHALS_06418 [Plasmopara halstedii]|eukprot:XP_024584974.1 hypothetical protein PHALS_06418 [Plasmopara halstedii]
MIRASEGTVRALPPTAKKSCEKRPISSILERSESLVNSQNKSALCGDSFQQDVVCFVSVTIRLSGKFLAL